MDQGASTLLNNLPIAGLVLESDGRMLALNPIAEDLLQRSARSVRGQAVEGLFADGQELLKLLHTAQERQVSVSSPELQIDNPQVAPVRVSAHLSPYEAGQWLLLLVPQPEEAMGARADALKTRAGSLSAMAAMLAHEIKNPLAAIQGAAQLMQSHNPEMVKLIVSETKRISQLLDTMELFSSPEDLEVSAVNVHQTLGEVVSAAQLSFGAGVRFVEDYDPSLPDVQANPHVLYRIFLNLVKNACEAFGDKPGQVRLKTRFHLAERRRIAGDLPSPDLPIRVSFIDNGPGVSAEMQDKIFDAFISTKDQGRGLGLAYVAGAVASMDGAIDLQSSPGKTEFQLRLPRA